jgi:predicted phosphatase
MEPIINDPTMKILIRSKPYLNKDLHIFDFDATLWDGKNIYPNVTEKIIQLRNKGHGVSMATFNLIPLHFMKNINMSYKLFDVYAYGRGYTKLDMVKRIHQLFPFVKRVIFYDDQQSNIENVKQGGYEVVYTPLGFLQN